jgi:hypothetical protein
MLLFQSSGLCCCSECSAATAAALQRLGGNSTHLFPFSNYLSVCLGAYCGSHCCQFLCSSIDRCTAQQLGGLALLAVYPLWWLTRVYVKNVAVLEGECMQAISVCGKPAHLTG